MCPLCDTRPRFSRFHPKDRPNESACTLTHEKGALRTYSNSTYSNFYSNPSYDSIQTTDEAIPGNFVFDMAYTCTCTQNNLIKLILRFEILFKRKKLQGHMDF